MWQALIWSIRQHTSCVRLATSVPQLLSADGVLTGYENLLVFARLYELPHQEHHARIHEALAFMNQPKFSPG